MRNRIIVLYYCLAIVSSVLLLGCETEQIEVENHDNLKIEHSCNHSYTYCEKDFYHSNYERILYEIVHKGADSLVVYLYAIGMCNDEVSGDVKITNDRLELTYSFIADKSIDYNECDCVFQITMTSYLIPEKEHYEVIVNNHNLEGELPRGEFEGLFEQFIVEFCNEEEDRLE